MNEQERLGSRLKTAREFSEINQSDAAKVLGLDNTDISKIESGSRAISALELVKLIKVYDVDIEDVLYNVGDKSLEELMIDAEYSKRRIVFYRKQIEVESEMLTEVERRIIEMSRGKENDG